jgi:hypothetical protein
MIYLGLSEFSEGFEGGKLLRRGDAWQDALDENLGEEGGSCGGPEQLLNR